MDPNEVISEGWWNTADDLPGGFAPPQGFTVGTGRGQYYAYQRTYRDGRRVIEWFKRGGGGGPDGGDAVVQTQQATVPAIKQKWDEAAAKPPAVVSAPPNQPNIVSQGPNGLQTTPNPNYTPPTNTTATVGRVEGTPLPDGSYDNTKPIWVERDAQGNQVGPAKPLTKDQRDQWERDKNGGLTDAEIRARNSPDAQVGKPTGNTRERVQNGTTVKETEYLLPDGSTVWRTQTAAGQPDLVGKPTGNTRQRNENGQVVKETEYILPDGSTVWRTQSAPSETNQPLPADMPPFRPDPNQPGLGVIEYAQQLAALRAADKLTDKQFAEFVGLAHQQVIAEAKRLDTIQSAQQQLQANEINQRATDINASLSRLGQANQATQNAFTTSQQMASNFTPASYGALSGPLLPAVMAVQDARAAAWGGMYQPPPIGVANYPMLAALQQMGMGPGAGVPTVEQLLASGQPNALGLGNVGTVAAPGAPAPAAGLPAPIFGPPPAVPGQTPVQAGNVAPAISDPRDAAGYTGPPAAGAVPVNLPAGHPGNDPTRPVGQAPVILPGVLQAGVLSEVAGSGRYPPDIVAEAARRLGWA